jgi:hypothetical protein
MRRNWAGLAEFSCPLCSSQSCLTAKLYVSWAALAAVSSFVPEWGNGRETGAGVACLDSSLSQSCLSSWGLAIEHPWNTLTPVASFHGGENQNPEWLVAGPRVVRSQAITGLWVEFRPFVSSLDGTPSLMISKPLSPQGKGGDMSRWHGWFLAEELDP